AFLAVKPKETRQAVAGAGWQANHDPADCGPASAARFCETFLDHYQRRTSPHNPEADSKVAEDASDCRARRTQHRPRHRTRRLSFAAPRSGCGDWNVSF